MTGAIRGTSKEKLYNKLGIELCMLGDGIKNCAISTSAMFLNNLSIFSI